MNVTSHLRWSIPLTQLGFCPDCEVAFNIGAGACPKCGAEHGWVSLLGIWKGKEYRKIQLDSELVLDKSRTDVEVP
jgi:hypothetical protein